MYNEDEQTKNKELVFTAFLFLLIGLVIGVFFQSGYSVGIRTFFHQIYVKINPETQKDSKTIIIEKVTKDTSDFPTNSIFDKPKKKENKIILTIKRMLPSKEKPQTINDNVE